MAMFWFLVVALMLVGYVVLDGFDLGVGAVYHLVAHTPEERAVVRRSIGPVWDANEVWLLAAGGTLYFAFPQLYAASFSGFYLPLMIVLWLLIGRALGLELRSHVGSLLADACDRIFVVSSALLAVFFGAALGNVVRGVPLQADGYFFLPLWTNFRAGPQPGVLDWYTVLAGVAVLVAIANHGALYLTMRTTGKVYARARHIARWGTRLLPVLTLLTLAGTLTVRPTVLDNFRAHPIGIALPMAVVASLVAMGWFRHAGGDRRAFLASCAYLASMLGGAAFALFPILLPASGDPALSLTVGNAATGPYAMRTAMSWWLVAFFLVLATTTHLYRTFRGRVTAGDEYH